MSGKTVLILGGGVGGLVTANELRRHLPAEHRILIIDRQPKHLHNPSLLWLMLGWREPAHIQAELSQLARQGIEFIQADIQAIDPDTRKVQTSTGEFAGDYLVVAMGAQPAPELTPGFAEAAHTPYTLEGATRLRDVLREFKGGRIVVAVTGLPYRCPAAPYETAVMIHTYLKKQGLREKTDLQMITPEEMPMGTAGPSMADAVKGLMAERNIPFRPLTSTRSIDAAAQELVLETGECVPFDLLVAIPTHRSPQVVRDSGLANDAGWIPVDAGILATRFDGVYALGDVTMIPLPGRFQSDKPLLLPKAGVFAHKQAEVVAHNLAVEIIGQGTPQSFDGFGGCFIELGDGRAGYGEGNFYDPQAPAVTLHPPVRRWHWGKVLIEKYWLWRWFAHQPGRFHKIGDKILFG
ncbi:MAG: NAD(P)/FAD-dependent oxidoreductase [Anaerolinea sp.]|nr:NAD(P)/FAD-dependent oxidoreductase [Anaerolinea sp.]